VTAPVVSAPPTASSDSDAPERLRVCAADVDCVAVDRVGCCHNGWKTAVAAAQEDAYTKSFACPDPHPICPMYLVRDDRAAACDASHHLCVLVRK
jgi:hypothetical protein